MAGRARRRELDGLDRDIVRLARRDWERARRVPEELAAELARASAEGQQSWQAARAADDFAWFAPALERNVELAREYGACVAERRAERRTRRCSATTTSACAPTSCAASSGRSREALPPLVGAASERSPPRTLEVPVAAQQAAVAGTLARLGVDELELARGRLRAPLHGLDRDAGHARDDPLQRRQRRVAAELAARVRPRAVRAPDRPGARPGRTSAAAPRCRSTSRRASCGRTTSRAARRSPSCSRPSSSGGGFAIAPARAARDDGRRPALADPRVGRPAHLSAAHHPALRARAGADRRRARGGRPAGGVARGRCAGCSAWRCPPTRSAACRTSTGAPAASATSPATRSAA